MDSVVWTKPKSVLLKLMWQHNYRLEEEDKLLNAESYYNKALAIDQSFTEAEEALNKVRQCIQVILYFLLISCE